MSNFIATTSWDDGHTLDIRLAELLDKYSVPATFYIPVKNPERKLLKPREIREVGKRFEIGGHTLNHKILTELSRNKAGEEIIQGKKKLEDILGREVESFAYPSGKYNQDIKQLVGFSGFKFARTVSLFGTSVGDKLLVPTTVHAYDHHPLVYLWHGATRKLFYSLTARGKVSFDWTKLAKASLDWCLENGGLFHLWGHSWEIDARGDWKRLEMVVRYISEVTPEKARKVNGQLISTFEKQKREYYKSLDPEEYKKSLDSPYHKSELKLLERLVNDFDKKGNKILDIGCGIGRVAEIFKNAEYTGVDFAENLIDFAKRAYPSGKFLLANYNELDRLELDKQDLILIWGMFEDEPDPLVALERLKTLVKRKTRLIFTLHNLQSPGFFVTKFVKTRFLEEPFAFTSFSKKFIESETKTYSKNHGYKFNVLTFGPTLVVVLDRI